MEIQELIRIEENGTLSFGNYELEQKSKLADFDYQGDKYKIKTFYEITKLERNGMLVYESTPGTTVNSYQISDNTIRFRVAAKEDVQITLGAEPEQDYTVYVNEANVGSVKTNLGGKLPISIEITRGQFVDVKVEKN